MLKYVHNLIQDFESRIIGIKANLEKWTSQSVTVTELEGYVTELQTVEADIQKAESALEQKRDAAHKLVDSRRLKLTKVDSLAAGIHAEESVKLADYGIDTSKVRSAKTIPVKAHISSITDCADGNGYIITFDKIPDADHYEIERGVASSTDEIVLAPPYPFFKSTSRASIEDETVLKGKRYFYRVRGINAYGVGEWSEPVSRIQ